MRRAVAPSVEGPARNELCSRDVRPFLQRLRVSQVVAIAVVERDTHCPARNPSRSHRAGQLTETDWTPLAPKHSEVFDKARRCHNKQLGTADQPVTR